MERERGPVEILCKEIGFRFDRRLERPMIFVAFVSRLIEIVAEIYEVNGRIASIVGARPDIAPTDNAARVLVEARAMVKERGIKEMVQAAAKVHDLCHELNPEDTYPTDHLIDMLSSCTSAIRFGLHRTDGIQSRHAAEAASHIWKHRYGVSLFDDFTPAWEKDWARAQLQEAIQGIALYNATATVAE